MDYDIDVIVPTHGRLDLTMQCMNALYSHTSAKFHLIVVDDSKDITTTYFEQFQKEQNNLTYIHSDTPYKSGNQFFNIALDNAVTPFVATVMNSIRVEPQWEIQALEIMRLYPKVGIIGFKCLFPDGRIEHAGIQMYDAKVPDFGRWEKVSTHCPVDIGRDAPGHQFSLTRPADAVQWAFALLRKEAVVGNLDEDAFNGFKGWDDIDNCYAVKKKGWQIMYCGTGVGYHTPRATRGDNSEAAFRQNEENAHAFFKRNGFWIGDNKDIANTCKCEVKLTEEQAN